jgi:hypothetical protein
MTRRPFPAGLLVVLALAAAGPACRTAGPKARPGPQAPPDLLATYVGELRVLRHEGDKRRITVEPGKRLSGACDVAVRVRSAAFEGAAARFSLATAGLPSVKGRPATCKQVLTGIQLVLTGFTTAEAEAVSARIDALLQTPEAYLESMGVTVPAGPAGEADPGAREQVASREPAARSDERSLGGRVSAWPEPLLTVEAWHHDASGRVRQQSEVEVEAVVDTNGRIEGPTVRTGMSREYEESVRRTLPPWRFAPARLDSAAVAARIVLRPVLRIY